MNKLEKIKLIDDIGRALQARMTFADIHGYFGAYGIPTDHNPSFNSKYVYVKEILPKIEDELIIKIANELNILQNFPNSSYSNNNTTTFWKTGHFKLFISHLASFKETIGHLKAALEKFCISGFVAHEDIEPTMEWQEEIEKGLFTMDALCAVLMPGFKESNWTDQETGVAIGREVLVIPVRKKLDPYGFIGKYQGFQSTGKNVDQVAEGIFFIISKHPKTKDKIIACIVDLLLLSNNKMEALERINALRKIIDLPKERVVQLRSRFTENKNLRHIEIIKSFNELIRNYEIEKVHLKDFDVIVEIDDDNLPF